MAELWLAKFGSISTVIQSVFNYGQNNFVYSNDSFFISHIKCVFYSAFNPYLLFKIGSDLHFLLHFLAYLVFELFTNSM